MSSVAYCNYDPTVQGFLLSSGKRSYLRITITKALDKTPLPDAAVVVASIEDAGVVITNSTVSLASQGSGVFLAEFPILVVEVGLSYDLHLLAELSGVQIINKLYPLTVVQ